MSLDAPLDKLSNFDNYYDESSTYVVRTKSEDFIKLIDGKENRPNSGILVVRRLDKSWDPEWTPVCAYNFNQASAACQNLGFSTDVGFSSAKTEDINDGNWEIRDGWRKMWDSGKFPYSEINTNHEYSQPKLINHEPFRKILLVHQVDRPTWNYLKLVGVGIRKRWRNYVTAE